jgi:dTDP-4-amino-4,6-dideoxygalactose transaminase
VINLVQPKVGAAELSAIADVFASNWIGPGSRVAEFERAFAEYIGVPADEVQAVSSCTEGLFQAAGALGLGPGDAVVLPSISFLGAAHAVRSTGARVVLCDVDPLTLNPNARHVEEALTADSRAVMILHYGGWPGEVLEVARLAESRSVSLIEDAACALGSFTADRACGTFGDIGVWSFDPMKLLTTGDGGMVWCRRGAEAAAIRRRVRLGVGSSGFDRRSVSERWWEIEPIEVGRRGTMNDIAGAMGLAQLNQIDVIMERRRAITRAYDARLDDLGWLRVHDGDDDDVARYYYWIQTSPKLRDRLAAHLLEHGVYVNFRYWPLHKTRMYRDARGFPGAEEAAARTLLLPLHAGLSDGDVERVVEAVRAFAA